MDVHENTKKKLLGYLWALVLGILLCLIAWLLHSNLPSIIIFSIKHWILYVSFWVSALVGGWLVIYWSLSLVLTLILLRGKKLFLWFFFIVSIILCVILLWIFFMGLSHSDVRVWKILILLALPLTLASTCYMYLFKKVDITCEDIINTEITKK